MLLSRLWTALQNLWPWRRPGIDSDTEDDDRGRTRRDSQAHFWQELRAGQREAEERGSRAKP